MPIPGGGFLVDVDLEPEDLGVNQTLNPKP